jgi:hypothetical protein
MTKLKVFTDEGINKFRDFLVELKNNPEVIKPDLSASQYSENFQPEILVDESRIFLSRMELAEYLNQILLDAGVKGKTVISNDKLWTWLTYLWFDQICPKYDNVRKIRELVRYICSTDWRKYYRHYVASSFRIYNALGREKSLLFLNRLVDDHGDYNEQLASRQEIISSPNLIEVAHVLYWNSKENRPKRGGSDRKKPGNLRRLIKLFGQIELTYDIFSMKASEIVKTLPKEFEYWQLN